MPSKKNAAPVAAEVHEPEALRGALTPKQAALYCAITERRLYDLTKAGEIKVKRAGPRLRTYRISDLDAYLAADGEA